MPLSTEALQNRLEMYAVFNAADLKDSLVDTLSAIDGFDADNAAALNALCQGISDYYNSRIEGIARAIVESLKEDAVVTVSGVQAGAATATGGLT